MEKAKIKPFIAARVAQELKDGQVVNLGIGIPTMVPKYLPKGIDIVLQSENGIIGTETAPLAADADPFYVTDAGGKPSSVASGGAFLDSATSFGLIRGGHVDCTILGTLQVDQEGSLANWIVPGQKISGMGGALDLVVGAKRVIIAMEHTVKGRPKILKKCTLPLTAVHCVDLIVTEMCVMEVTAQGLVLKEYNPEFTMDEIRQHTEADFTVAEDVKEMQVEF